MNILIKHDNVFTELKQKNENEIVWKDFIDWKYELVIKNIMANEFILFVDEKLFFKIQRLMMQKDISKINVENNLDTGLDSFGIGIWQNQSIVLRLYVYCKQV